MLHHINKLKKKHMVLTIGIENCLTKYNIYSWFKKKTLSKLEIQQNFFNLINNIYIKPTTNIRINYEQLEVFPLR